MNKGPKVFFVIGEKREEGLKGELARVFTDALVNAFTEYFENNYDEWIKISEQYKDKDR